jgi:hypothetical protein
MSLAFRTLIAYLKVMGTCGLIAVAFWGLGILGEGIHDSKTRKDILGIAIAVGAIWLMGPLWRFGSEPVAAQPKPKPTPPSRPNRQIAELD